MKILLIYFSNSFKYVINIICFCLHLKKKVIFHPI